MLRIGEVSKLTKTSVKTLRYYDQIGLLKPAFVDRDSGYRYYTPEQVALLHRIIALKQTGLSNEEIHQAVSEGEHRLRQLLADRQNAIAREMQSLERQRSVLNSMLSRQEGLYQAVIQDIPGYTVSSCRGYIRDPGDIAAFMSAAAAELRRLNPELPYILPDYCCIIYPGNAYRERNTFIEYCQAVEHPGVENEIIRFRKLDATRAICVEHRGSYHTLGSAYLFAVQYAIAQGLELLGKPRERYINGAWNGYPQAEWLTEVQLPVKRKENP